MTVFHGIDGATAEFFFGPRVGEFASVRYQGRKTEETPSFSRSFMHIDTYRVVRHGEITCVEVPEGDGSSVGMSQGTEFDVVITDHGSDSGDRKRRYGVEVVRREVRIGMSDDRKVVVTADFDCADDSPATVHRTAMRMVVDRFPPRRTKAPSDVPVAS